MGDGEGEGQVLTGNGKIMVITPLGYLQKRLWL